MAGGETSQVLPLISFHSEGVQMTDATTSTTLTPLRALLARDDVPREVREVIASAIQATPLANDKWIYRVVVLVLGITVIGAVFGGIAIAIIAKGDVNMKLPDAVVAIGSAAVGALAGLLAPSPVGRAQG